MRCELEVSAQGNRGSIISLVTRMQEWTPWTSQ